jgi:DNA-binding CsgD family transcriptional regulator
MMEVAPTVPRNAIPRPRIAERLGTAATYPITLVIAPAGFGKTIAIKSLLAQSDQATIYVPTPRATSFEFFIQAFARACSSHFSEMAMPPREPDAGSDDTDGRINLYAAWAAVHLQASNCTIAIDDLQYADHDRSIGIYLSRLADSTKGYVKWIFCSRTRGSLPVTRWQTYGDADVAITADDLRMTLDEAVAYGASLNCPATIEQIETWVAQTRGFPVPLAYAIRLAARRHTVDDIMDGTRAVTFRFLAEQLWASLSPDERGLLEVAAFAPAIQMHSYENSGVANASEIISRLCDDIAFLDLTPDGLFSMHDLFRAFIKQLLSQSGSATQRNRFHTAAEMLLTSGYHNEGFALLLESTDSDYIAEAIELHQYAECNLTVTRRLVEATEILNPRQLGLRALELQAEHWSWMGKAHRSFKCAQEIFGRTDASSAQILCAIRAIFRMVNMQGTEEQERWSHLLAQHFERLNETDLVQAFAYQACLLARCRGGDAEARVLIRRVQGKLDLLEPSARVDAFLSLASALFFLKDNEASLHATREAATLAKLSGDAREIARALNFYGLMLLHLHDSEAEAIFDPLRDAVERTGSWRFSQVSHWWPALYYALQGNLLVASGARQRQSVVITSEESQKPFLLSYRRHSTNLCNVLREEYRFIISDSLKNGAPKRNDSAYELLSDLAVAYAFTSKTAECEEVLVRLKRLRLSLSTMELLSVRIAMFVEMIALCLIGQWAAARRLNEQHRGELSSLAPLEDAFSLFCQGPPFIGVMKALEACDDRPYMGLPALLMHRVIDRQLADQQNRILTKAEADVLRLLEIGKSNKEIASSRYRSTETIKRQVASLYRKLGVENRTSAVAVARERGLL